MMIDAIRHISAPSCGLLHLHAKIPSELREAIIRCANILYDDTWPAEVRTACIFTSMMMAASLRWMGFDARPTAVAVEGQCPGARFGIGHPAYPLVRPGAWKGHLVCMVGDVLVDPTISQVRRWGADAPLLIAVRCARPWSPEARVALSSGCTLTWTAEGANGAWPAHPDAAVQAWRPAAMRVIRRLHLPAEHMDAAD